MDAVGIMSLIGAAQGVGQITDLFATLSKAKLLCKEKGMLGSSIISDDELEFQFNPSTLKLNREPDWDDGEKLSAGAYRAVKFGGNRADRLNFTILLDESEYRGKLTALTALMPMSGLGNLLGFLFQNKSNTLSTMQQLYALTFPYVKMAKTTTEAATWRPPLVVFKWGDFSFSGVVDSLEYEMLLFDMDGNPRRATVDISLKGRAFCNMSKAGELLQVMSPKEFEEMASRQKNAAMMASMQQSLLGGGQTTD